ncbi:P-loop NTPase fold protein [Sphaerisporangium sp. NPDC051017]|uniref:KAP family P-loop NTPase fold protein n=1 Tax=Sphaerisporangium sp. NPDC051017 TaxID=3154636 RepID=UPI00342116C1
MTSLIISAPPAPAIRTRKALVFLDREGVPRAAGADRRLVHALTAEGYAVETAEGDAADHGRVGAFLDTVEPGDLLLVRWSTESGWGRREFGALMDEFAGRVERSDGAALLLIVDFGWLVSASPGPPHEATGRLPVRGEPVVAAAALTTSALVPARHGRPVSLTGILADGILSGEADLDRDGTVSVGDLFRYAQERCAGLGADRAPFLLTYGEGELIGVASPRRAVHDLGEEFGPALARLAVLGDAVPPMSAAELVNRIYEVHLGPDARQLLRRAALLEEDEPLTPEVARLLAEGGPPEEALRELRAWGLLGRDAPLAAPAIRHGVAGRLEAGEPAHVSALLRRRRAAARPVRPRARLTGDRWTLQDRLGHRVHAEAVAAFIRHPDTRPPLTIGVKGPWGAGKTSLMRMIQDLLDPGAAEDRAAEIHLGGPDAARRARRRRGRVTNAEVLARAKRPEEEDTDRATPGELPLRPGHWRPTVWFNPWMYQNGEQVWAGLAHEIISQVTGRLPRGERERFWLTLNLSRVDREAVRRRGYGLAATRLLPVALALCGTLLFTGASLAAGALFPAVGSLLRGTAAAVGSGGSLLLMAAAAVRLTRFLGESADTAFRKLVRQPDLLGSPAQAQELAPDPGYRSRTGFLHLVQTDMRRVLGMVATEERPLVVFVDDLDRCSPGTVAQVIEAVNLFLAGDFPNCVFVLAMEPEVVAAHVEVAYQDLARTLPSSAEERSGLGWRFLEKIIQLPLSVPLLDDGERIPAYLRTLLDVPPAREGPVAEARDTAGAGGRAAQPDPELVDRMESAIRALRPTAEDLDAVARRVQDAVGATTVPGTPGPGLFSRRTSITFLTRTGPTRTGAVGMGAPRGRAARTSPRAPYDAIGGLGAAARLAADRVYDDIYSDENAYAAIERVLPALTLSNPRELKRYVNVFRFYSFVTYRRALAGAPRASDDEVAKLAVLTVRWPHLLSLFARDAEAPDGEPNEREDSEPPGEGRTVLERLERAAAVPGRREWARALAEAGLLRNGKGGAARWDALRVLLSAPPSVAGLARDLL